MTAFLGIDPGLSGGIAILGPVKIHAEKTPITGTEKRTMNLGLCAKIVKDALDEYGSIFAVIEKVGAMPKQGVSSTFSFGRGYGSWLGLLSAYGIAYQECTPQSWKKAMLEGTDKSKDASINLASTLFPHVKLIPPGARTPHDGIAEALLLAEFARRKYVNGA